MCLFSTVWLWDWVRQTSIYKKGLQIQDSESRGLTAGTWLKQKGFPSPNWADWSRSCSSYLEEINLFAWPIKEFEITFSWEHHFKDEVFVCYFLFCLFVFCLFLPVWKQIWAKQTRLRACVTNGDSLQPCWSDDEHSRDSTLLLSKGPLPCQAFYCPCVERLGGTRLSQIVPCKVTGFCSYALETAANSQYWQWLHTSQRLYCYPGQLCLGLLLSDAPNLQKETVFTKSPYHELPKHPVNTHTKFSTQETQAAVVVTTHDCYRGKINWIKTVKKDKQLPSGGSYL